MEMLAFPRQLARDGIVLEQCQHWGNYSPNASDCAVCTSRLECEWLYHNDESTAPGEKSLDVIVGALGSALLYVDACMARAGHDVQTCRCDACDWLRRAQRLHDDAESAR